MFAEVLKDFLNRYKEEPAPIPPPLVQRRQIPSESLELSFSPLFSTAVQRCCWNVQNHTERSQVILSTSLVRRRAHLVDKRCLPKNEKKSGWILALVFLITADKIQSPGSLDPEVLRWFIGGLSTAKQWQ